MMNDIELTKALADMYEGDFESKSASKIQMLPIELLSPHPDNPRKELGDLTELADSIRERVRTNCLT